MGEHPYARFIDRVTKPAQYLGGEQGEVRKPWDDARCRICLAFPDLYEIGMSHLGYKILYDIVNQVPDLIAERAYAVWPDMEAALRAHEQSLCSLESARALHEFDIVGFSLQYELTYTNVLQVLDLGGIALRSEDRVDGDPLVIAGGPTATHAEPMSAFIDAFLIGDGEAKLPALMNAWAAMRDEGLPRPERLRRIAQLGGIYVPSLYTTVPCPDTGVHVVERADPAAPFPVIREMVPDLNAYPFPVDGPIANCQTVFDRASIEIARGCTEGCRFCQAGMIYRPVRERDPNAIVDAMVRSVEEAGYDEASLTSLSTADYSAIAPLVRKSVEALDSKQVTLSVSSLRAYGLGENVLDDMKTQRAGGLTFAPEAGSQRMRDVVNKNVTDEQLMETAERVFSRGWSKMKLYFMIGLPTEEDEDVRDIVRTGARALGRRAPRRSGQQAGARDGERVDPRSQAAHALPMVRDGLARRDPPQAGPPEATRYPRHGVQPQDAQLPKGSWLEGTLARGDRRLGDVNRERITAKGARFDSWDERAQPRSMVESAIDELRQSSPSHVPRHHPRGCASSRGTTSTSGLEPGFLAREYRKSLRQSAEPSVRKDDRQLRPPHQSPGRTGRCAPAWCVTTVGSRVTSPKMRHGAHRFSSRAWMRIEARRPPSVAAKDAKRRKSIDAPSTGWIKALPRGCELATESSDSVAYTSHLDLRSEPFPRMLRGRSGFPSTTAKGFARFQSSPSGPPSPWGPPASGELRRHPPSGGRARFQPSMISARQLNRRRDRRHRVLRIIAELGPRTMRRSTETSIEEAQYVVALSRNDLRGPCGLRDGEASLRERVCLDAERPRGVAGCSRASSKRVDVESAALVGHRSWRRRGRIARAAPDIARRAYCRYGLTLAPSWKDDAAALRGPCRR